MMSMAMHDDLACCAADFPDPYRLLLRQECGSTNDELRALALQGAPHGLVLLAERQTAGRGRRGAAWYAAPQDSLVFTVLLRPNAPKTCWPRLALAAGEAVAEALDRFHVEAGIKWPNDVWVHGRKIAGILVEAGTDFVLIGIGININTIDFPPEVETIATSLRLATGQTHRRAEVLAEVIHHLAQRTAEINEDFPSLLHLVRQRCVLTGHPVRLISASGIMSGRVVGIADSGALQLQTPEGLQELLQADEIRLL